MGKTYFFSDVHLGMNDDKEQQMREAKLLDFLAHVAETGDRLFIVGDLFDFWFEYKTVIPRGYTRVIGALSKLKELGKEVHYIAGNHDFWLGDYLTEELNIQLHFDELIYEINGKKFFLHHGDGIAKDDKGYRLLKRVLRNKTNIFLYRLLHPDFGIPLAKWVSSYSRNHNKFDVLDDSDYREEAQLRFSEGCDYAIFGHLHSPIMDEYDGKYYVNLGDWIEHFTYAVFDGEKLELLEWK